MPGNLIATESTLLISRISLVAVLYLIIDSFFPNSRVNIVISGLFLAGVINQSNMFQNLKKYVSKGIQKGDFKLQVDDSRGELLATLFDLESYLKNGSNWNKRHRLLFKQMSNQQQAIANKINYSSKLNKVDQLMIENNKVLKNIVAVAKLNHNVTDTESRLYTESSSISKRNNYFPVIESLCHFARDWSSHHVDEIEPLILYIKSQIKDLDSKSTTVVVPGSGLGRVAYEMSKMNFSAVHAVEYSWLMVLMNEYMFTGNKSTIYPYLHTYSNHVTNADQMRSVEINHLQKKPDSLKIHKGDFNKFNIEEHLNNSNQNDNVVIVTCFFLDTAENLIEYVQSINRICEKFKGKKRWVNVGPLKYGTAAQVELSDEELKKLIKVMGWKLTNEEDPELLGYLTDKKGLWQGYYNVLKWTSEM